MCLHISTFFLYTNEVFYVDFQKSGKKTIFAYV